jgi:hypothetical protein
MTAHGPEAIRLVGNTYTNAGLLIPTRLTVAITGHALDVIKGRASREGAIYGLMSRHDLERPLAAKLLDLAVEALTANPPQE